MHHLLARRTPIRRLGPKFVLLMSAQSSCIHDLLRQGQNRVADMIKGRSPLDLHREHRSIIFRLTREAISLDVSGEEGCPYPRSWLRPFHARASFSPSTYTTYPARVPYPRSPDFDTSRHDKIPWSNRQLSIRLGL